MTYTRQLFVQVLVGSIVMFGVIYVLSSSKGNSSRSAYHMAGPSGVPSDMRLVDVIRTPSKIMPFKEYMEEVHGRRNATDDEIWQSLSRKQKEWLACSNFNTSVDLKGLSQWDLEPVRILFPTLSENVCLSVRLSVCPSAIPCKRDTLVKGQGSRVYRLTL